MRQTENSEEGQKTQPSIKYWLSSKWVHMYIPIKADLTNALWRHINTEWLLTIVFYVLSGTQNNKIDKKMNIPIKILLLTRKPINFPSVMLPAAHNTCVRCKWWTNRGVLILNIKCRVQCRALVGYSYIYMYISQDFDCYVYTFFLVDDVRFGFFFRKINALKRRYNVIYTHFVYQIHLSNRIFNAPTKPLTK